MSNPLSGIGRQVAGSAKISPKQVAMLRARAWGKGIRGEQALLEWIEFNCGMLVYRLEDVPRDRVSFIVEALGAKD